MTLQFIVLVLLLITLNSINYCTCSYEPLKLSLFFIIF